MTVKFQRERAQDIFADLKPLFEAHWKELTTNPDVALDPDFDTYRAIEDAGALRCFTARDADKEIIGYAIFFVRSNLHNKTSLRAFQDLVFIKPDCRGGGRGFIKWCDKELESEKVQFIVRSTNAASDFGPPILKPMGYELVNHVYQRRLF